MNQPVHDDHWLDPDEEEIEDEPDGDDGRYDPCPAGVEINW